ncbi:UBP9-binding protein [Lachnellula hyalina]|uniref:UBP9-binding protein n=1 Tax=Lachnellula hyalina TaxID=1316788 RepID=A0A8H8QXY6_9HELO|nr:UBP9-binding protein [Lachnellula hyalina]TVY23404.1 UBP9-binding protein [Lachnellula hyalina]
MVKKAKQRVSYVLPLANSPGGHRLGVNGLAVDSHQSILYSGGRDGAICAWNLNLNLNLESSPDAENPFESAEDPPEPTSNSKASTTFRAQTQAHTHWVNDIVLAQNNTALVSASSDLTVKVWHPFSDDLEAPQTIGQHADYVKCLATPNSQADWVASGGLDRKICLWDLSGAGKKLEIEVGDEEKSEKGSVYALSASRSILASGGPESIVRLWDPRSGKRVTKFVGHTDNIRDILINETGDTIMTASSDQTVKVWSVTAGRCMHTLTMHNDSVWSLYSDDPQLGIFYSGDRSGLVVKTDVRGTLGEMDDGLSLAVAQEHDGVNKVIAHGDYIWTATSSSSINRWSNVDTGADIQLPEAYRRQRASSVASRPKQLSPPTTNGHPKKEIPAQSVLKISHTASFPSAAARDPDTATTISALSAARKGSEIIVDPDIGFVVPILSLPEETIEGQHGLVKHKLLNDRRRALTLDTAGDVLLWDLLRCIPIQSFGKRHLEDVEPEVNTMEAVAPWCSIDTRTGRLAVVLEEYNCFDAEMYADELELEEPVEFRDDQRINLGKWVLRYIFANLIDEAIKRDEDYRKELNENVKKGVQRANAPTSIQLPPSTQEAWVEGTPPTLTPRANGNSYPMTPGMGIGVATPSAMNHLPGVPEDGAPLDKRASHASRVSGDKDGDYFSSTLIASETAAKSAATPGEGQDEKPPKSPSDVDKENNGGKDTNTLFGKKFRMGMSFGSKKLGRSPSTNIEKPVVVDEKVEDGSDLSENGEKEKEVDDSFFGVVQTIRNEYDKALLENPDRLVESGITPSLPNETPVLKHPPMTTVIVQEETSGGSADLYRGTVATVGEDASLIEQRAPMWVGDLLLRNKIPFKEPVKVSFILQPWQDLLPSIAGPDGNARLNANRMLRVKKILAYVAERIEAAPETPDPDALKPEEYLELYCYDQKLPITMSLATLRAHVWKGGADVMLYYKSNGRKQISQVTPPEPSTESPPDAQAAPP